MTGTGIASGSETSPRNLWTAEETAAFLKVPVGTLYRWRYVHQGPKGHKIGKHLRFDPEEVRRWVTSQ